MSPSAVVTEIIPSGNATLMVLLLLPPSRPASMFRNFCQGT